MLRACAGCLTLLAAGCSTSSSGSRDSAASRGGLDPDASLVWPTDAAAGEGAADATIRGDGQDLAWADSSPEQLAYLQLLSAFPEDNQGLGVEVGDTAPIHADMTYGLVLSAEAIRYRRAPSDEGRRRVRKATRWFLENQVDWRGKPGWPWPQQFDGVHVNSIYAIDHAISLNGVLDALAIPAFWSADEQTQLRAMIKNVVLRWCRELWRNGAANDPPIPGGWFYYGDDPKMSFFGVNASSMLTGSLVQVLDELDQHRDLMLADERALVESRVDDVARAMISTVRLRKPRATACEPPAPGAMAPPECLPYWGYIPLPGQDPTNEGGHDTLHHSYTISGIERYRKARGSGAVKLPWTRDQAVRSLDTFWYDGHINSYSADDPRYVFAFPNQPAILWCAGFMLRTFGMWGALPETKRAYEAILRDYGPPPRLSYYAKGLPRPRNYSYQGDNTDFFPRWAAHVLVGMAYHAYGN